MAGFCSTAREQEPRQVRLSSLVIAALCRGRVVRVPSGSLVRVAGTELVIPCNVSDYDGPSEQNFDWSFSSSGSGFVELASTWEAGFPAQPYQERLQRGDILLRRTANDAVELHIRNVQPSDQGHYKCSTPSTDATVQGNYEDTVQVKGYEHKVISTCQASEQLDTLRASVARNVSVSEGKELDLTCNITTDRTDDVRPEVTWHFSRTPDSAVPGSLVLARLDRDSLVHSSPHVALSHADARSYHLLVRDVSKENSGYYFCHVALWAPGHNRTWHKVAEARSAPASVDVTWLDSVLVVKARQPKPFFAAGNTFEMTCKVSSKNIKSPRYSVLITAEKPVGDLSSPNETKYIISLDQDSVVKLENWTDASRVDGVVLEKVQEDEFRYRMYQTQVSDAGLYRCVVTAWSPVRGSLWREAATSLSNPIEIDFQTAGPVFNASVHSDTPSVIRGELIKLFCIITVEGGALDPDDMAFDVSWFAVHSFGLDKAPALLSSLDRKGIVTTAERDWKSELSLERVGVLEFLLQVHGSEDQDFGNYYCSVTPWVKSPTGSWQKEAEIYSKPIFVTVKMDVLNAFKYPLLIGVGLSTVIGLLSCLIGYCSSHWCCKKEVQETRRERRRLMSMEMD
ncbi:prostaglandin F2 receptor negative regulator [Suricata suricatta]|uniref:prostaglandin F2 receptor negative regulator n=1 Tax=Suricata suricatta TaxID=37032 RepID=UPI00115606E7|nr:prostaglandin F2 receptor negative regulator [Suricata suricatta]